MKINKTKSLLVVVIFLIAIIAGLLLLENKAHVTLDCFCVNENEVEVKVEVNSINIFKKYYVAVDQNKQIMDNTIFYPYKEKNTFVLNNGSNYVHVKDNKGNIVDIEGSGVISLQYLGNLNYPFYPEDIDLDIQCDYIGLNTDLTISSSDESVVEVIGNKLHTKAKGNSTISLIANDTSVSFEIEVTDLYTDYDSNSDLKPYLKETICNEEQAHKLDEVLKLIIDEAGYKTRAGVVAAARFLALQFPYKIAYMSESGRLDPNYHLNTDGEGRYYHLGLFLSEDKFDELGLSRFGRATWGQFFEEDDSDDHSLDEYYLSDGFVPSDIGSHLYLSKRPNGLDCSGYVSWIYLNGGFDLGDIGAGGPDTPGMSQLGERVNITDDLLKSNRIKAGDLIGNAGHIGMVIGVEDDYIWVTDTLITGTKVTRYERNKASFDELGIEAFKYFMLMDDEYKVDGNYTAMWE